MMTFVSLLMVHLLADFYLQRSAWIRSKIKYKVKSIGLLKHIGVHLILNAVVLWLLIGAFTFDYFIALSVIVLTHYAIDIWKSYQQFGLRAFLIDQIAHVLVLVAISTFLSGLSVSSLVNLVSTLVTVKVMAIAASAIFLTKPVSFIVQLSLVNYTRDLHQNDSHQGLGNAGEWIGILERLLVFTLVLVGQYAGVGFLLAAKSVFRFGDMREQKDRKLTEYIMLGSLLSIGIALLCGILIHAVWFQSDT